MIHPSKSEILRAKAKALVPENESQQATVAVRKVTAERLVILDAAGILADRRILVHEEIEA